MRPLLKPDWELYDLDLVKHSIWMCVHGRDEDEPWYEDCDEATFRPWDGSAKALKDRLLLVPVSLTLKNGLRYPGACYAGALGTPPGFGGATSSLAPVEAECRHIRELQPRIFVNDRSIGFWGGFDGVPADDRRAFYAAVDDVAENVFPILFDAGPGVLPSSPKGVIRGFYRLLSVLRDEVAVETTCGPSAASPETSEPITDPDRTIGDLIRSGELEEALRRIDGMLAADAHNESWWQLRSIALELSGDPEGALTAAKKAVACKPHDDGLYIRVCKLHVELKDFQGCLTNSESGLAAAQETSYSEILAFYGARALYELGRPKEAIERLRPVSRDFFFGKSGDALMSRAGLLSACKAAVEVKQELGRPARRRMT